MIAGRTLTGGTYYLRVGHYNNSSNDRPVRHQRDRHAAVACPDLEREATTAASAPSQILLPGDRLQARNGSIGSAGDVDYYKFAAETGDEFFFGLDANPGRNSSGPDLVLEVLDETGVLLTCDSSTASTVQNSAAEGCA
jgi:hypothetical protein